MFGEFFRKSFIDPLNVEKNNNFADTSREALSYVGNTARDSLNHIGNTAYEPLSYVGDTVKENYNQICNIFGDADYFGQFNNVAKNACDNIKEQFNELDSSTAGAIAVTGLALLGGYNLYKNYGNAKAPQDPVDKLFNEILEKVLEKYSREVKIESIENEKASKLEINLANPDRMQKSRILKKQERRKNLLPLLKEIDGLESKQNFIKSLASKVKDIGLTEGQKTIYSDTKNNSGAKAAEKFLALMVKKNITEAAKNLNAATQANRNLRATG
jgi:hypothetical protein